MRDVVNYKNLGVVIYKKIDFVWINKSTIRMSSPSVDDFIMLSQIGKGTYAKVILVRYKSDNKLYALKMLKKKYIIEKNQ
jgi:serine/threonine protein kinase